MVVQKVSVNTPSVMSFGAGVAPQEQQVSPAKPRKDYTKAIGWVAAGLATAGLAGVLIYNARKGKVSAGSDDLQGVGTYLRKFLDDSIFTKSAEAVKNGSQDVAVKISSDGNDWQLCDFAQNLGCHLVKKVPDANTPHLEFDSRPLNIKIFNKDSDSARFDFILGEFDDFKLSIDVDSWRGKVKNVSATDFNNDSYSITAEQGQSVLESLDMKRLVDDPNYRVMYTQSLFQMVGDTVKKVQFQKIADKSGKTFEEVQNIYNSKEFNGFVDVKDMLAMIHHRYGLPDSGTFASLKGKDCFGMLDDFISGNSKLNIIDDFVETDVRFPADKTCYELSIPSADGSGVVEHLRFSHDKEYILYERFNPEDAADKFKVKCYYPALTDQNSCVTDLETKGASFFMETTLSGRNYVEVTHPTSSDPLKFYFNSNRKWDEDIDYGDELQPYMSYIEKIANTLSDEEGNWKFIQDFATKGKEMLEEFAK